MRQIITTLNSSTLLFSHDVGKLISRLVLPDHFSSAVFNQSYNLSFKQTLTLKQLYMNIANWLGIGGDVKVHSQCVLYLIVTTFIKLTEDNE